MSSFPDASFPMILEKWDRPPSNWCGILSFHSIAGEPTRQIAGYPPCSPSREPSNTCFCRNLQLEPMALCSSVARIPKRAGSFTWSLRKMWLCGFRDFRETTRPATSRVGPLVDTINSTLFRTRSFESGPQSSDSCPLCSISNLPWRLPSKHKLFFWGTVRTKRKKGVSTLPLGGKRFGGLDLR